MDDKGGWTRTLDQAEVGKTMDSCAKAEAMRWVFAALVLLAGAVTVTIFQGLSIAS